MKIANFFLIALLTACTFSEKSGIEVMLLSQDYIDSIVEWSDSIAVEETDGVKYASMETYYLTGSPISKRLLRDSVGNIRSIITLINGHFLQSENYFENGQLEGNLTYSSPGILDGPATYYFPDGRIKTIGTFNKGIRWGTWKSYDESGRLVLVDYHDEEGNLLKSVEH